MPTDQSPSQQVVSPGGGVRKILGAAVRFAKVQGQSPSSWRGLVMILSACGVALSPETSAAIIAAGMALSGLIGVFAGPDAPAGE
jgi:hypothetical protein